MTFRRTLLPAGVTDRARVAGYSQFRCAALSTAGRSKTVRRRRYLWALIPAFLAIGQFGIQGAISAYGNLHDWAYSWSYEIRWVVDFAIYLAYLAGLASFDTWRRGRIWIALAFTAAFFTLTIGGFTDSKPGMIAWMSHDGSGRDFGEFMR